MSYPVTYPFMLESGMLMQITIPDGGTLTRSDAERVGTMLKTLVMPESQPKPVEFDSVKPTKETEMTHNEPTPEKVEQLGSQVLTLIQFAALLVEDIDILEKVALQSTQISSSTLTLAPILGAVGADYEKAHMEAEVKRKRAEAILNLVKTIKQTEDDRTDFKKKSAGKAEAISCAN